MLIYISVAVLFIVFTGVYYSMNEDASPVIFILLAVGAALIIAFVGILFSIFRKEYIDTDSQIFTGINIEYLTKTPTPLMLCDGNSIVWVNDAFTGSVTKNNPVGYEFDRLFGIGTDRVAAFGSSKKTIISRFDKTFYISCGKIASKKKDYYVILWEDTTDLFSLKRQLTESETFIAYIVADNLEEAGQFSSENIRAASAKLLEILTSWVGENGGVIKEYRTDRYMALFDQSTVDSFIRSKFDILDKIREIKLGDSGSPLTISIGIGTTGGKLAEKERSSSEALEMALQRGGDQAVVKTTKGLEFFGGATQTVQKSTKVKARVIANELISCINSSSLVLIQGHKNADYDAIGACLGVARMCMTCGKKFRIVTDLNTQNYRRCAEWITKIPDLSGKNVFVSSGDATEYLSETTLCVFVDFNNTVQAECPELVELSSRSVYIDHHRKAAEFRTQPLISYIEPSSSSSCELVAEILEQFMTPKSLSEYEADLMYSGILLDTNQFEKNTGVRTLSAAMFLRSAGAEPKRVRLLFTSSAESFVEESRFGSNVMIYRGCIAISYNDVTDDTIVTARAADRLLEIDGIKASFTLCTASDGNTHVSARSGGEVNVQLILEPLGGGGRFDSAALRTQAGIKETIATLKKAIDDYFENLSQEV